MPILGLPAIRGGTPGGEPPADRGCRPRLLAAPGRAMPLRRLQSRYVGDYAAWLLVGTSLPGAPALPGVLGN
ncbi:hypothetical protein ACIPIU_02980 [Streptomyces massasporeus]|uniref:hypothetical protein n=1 Tax=Streptomyces massasporeus TaxID=67324 RepID=UPI00380081C7